MNLSRPVSATENPNRAKSIMALDQDEESCLALQESLDELGHRTQLFSSFGDRQIPEFDLAKFDLVICDLDNRLGVWTHLLDRIRKRRLDTQIVLASQRAAEREWLEALQLGAFDLLVKPYSKSEVLRVITNALAMNYNRQFTTV